MSNLSVIPFTEMYERLRMEELRDNASNVQAKYAYRSKVNDAYRITIPMENDWRFLLQDTTVTLIPVYETGTIDLTNGSTTVSGTGTTFTSAMAGRLLVCGKYVYTISAFVSTTEVTLSSAFLGTTTTDQSFKVIKHRYTLATNFSYPVADPKAFVYYYNTAGKRVYLDAEDEVDYNENVQFSNPSSNPVGYRIDYADSELEIYPPLNSSSEQRYLYYSYIPTIAPLIDEQTGTVAVTNASTAVTGTSSLFTNMAAGDYFRIDSDGLGSRSVWYKISSVTNTTALVLTTAYGGTTASSKEFTISKIPLYYPTPFHLSIIYRAAIDSAATKESQLQLAFWNALYNKVKDQFISQERKEYGATRIRTGFKKISHGR